MTPETPAETKRLLVVDDEPSITKLLKTVLTRAGYQVTACHSAEEAIRALSQIQFHLIITDAMMPVMTGIDLVRTVRANPTLQTIPILMLTRKSERADVQKALLAGVTDYVLKPVDPDLLIDKAQLLLKSQDGNRLREVGVHGNDSIASVQQDACIISLRETGLTVRFRFVPPAEGQYTLDAPVFKQMGISTPILKMTSFHQNIDGEHHHLREFPYKAEFTFVGMPEKDLQKIRAWMQQQEIQRKK